MSKHNLLLPALLLLMTACGTKNTGENNRLIVHPTPREVIYSLHNDDFTVRARVPGGEWKDLFEYTVVVDMDSPQNASMVQFDFEGEVEVAVKKNNGTIGSVDIRPLSRHIHPSIDGNTFTFTLKEPQKLSIEVNGDRLHNLHLFANAPETEVPSPQDSNVIYFDAGLHKPEGGRDACVRIPSNTTVYLAPGAILQAKLLVDKAENVRILGRGFIHRADRGIEVTHSRDVLIDGITVINPTHYSVFGGQTTQLTVRNLKSFSSRGWSDGIDLMSCSDVLVEDVFMRNSDDCIAIYGHRWNYYGGVKNITVQNSVLWADIAHPTNIGIHGDTTGDGDVIEDILFSNIDILEHDEDDRDYQGCMAICAGDKNLVRNVTYDGIRVESIQEGQLFHLRVVYNEKYNKAPGRGIENITFRNISYSGRGENSSVIHGLNEGAMVSNVTFENIMLNKKRVRTAKDLHLSVEHADGIEVY